MPTEMLGPNDAADYLGVSRATLHSWRQARIGPAFTILGTRAKYSKADLDAYLEAQRFDPAEHTATP